MRFPATLQPEALYGALQTGRPHSEAADLVRELGRCAAREGWARRFLFDVARGRLAMSPQQAAPALAELARLSLEPVVELLRSGDAHGSLAAAVAFGLDFEAFGEPLLEAARGQDSAVRLAAAGGLGEATSAGFREATDCLAGLLRDRDPQVRWTAALQLGRSRGAGAARALESLAEAAESDDERLRSGAVFGLARLCEVRPGPCLRLLRTLAKQDPAARRSVAFVLRQLPRRAGAGLASLCLSGHDPDTRAVAVGALAVWAKTSEASRRELLRLAGDPHPLVRATAAEAIAAEEGPDQDAVLKRLADDGSPLVRSAVARGLTRRAPERRDLLARLAEDEVGYVRRAAIAGLDLRREDRLREVLRDPDPGVRAAASSALKPESPEDRDLLLDLTHDRDVFVAGAAAGALARAPGALEGPAWSRLLEVGSGAALAAALDGAPEQAAEAVWRWPLGPRTVEVFADIARSARAWPVTELARTAWRALQDEEELAGSLADLAGAFRAAGEASAGEQLQWLSTCARCDSAREIAEVENLSRADRSDALSLLALGGREVAGALRADDPIGMEPRSGRAEAAIERLLGLDDGTILPRLAQRVGLWWREIVRRDFDAAGGAPVQARLLSTRVVVGGPSRVIVEIENLLQEPLKEAEVMLSGGSGPSQARAIQPGETREVEIPWTAAETGSSVVRGEVRYGHPRGGGRVEFEGVVTAKRPGAARSAANPYVVGKPLTAGSAMFFGRTAEMEYVERALAEGENGSLVVLTGQRRTGKTSLLRQLAARLSPRYRPAFIDVQGLLVENTGEFFQEVVRTVGSTGNGGEMLSDGDPVRHSRYSADLVRETAENSPRPVVLLMDEFDDLNQKVDSGRIGPEVFAQLRSLIQHTPNLRLVLCGTHRLEEFAGAQWSFLLNLATHRRIRCFGRGEGARVLRVPLARVGLVSEEAAVLRGLRLTGGHPYFLQLLGYRLVEECLSSGRTAIWVDSIEEAADQVIEQGDIHLRYLWESAGPEGQPVIMALAEAEGALEESELAARLDLSPEQLRLVLERLIAYELIVRNGTAYALRVGLLSRWLQKARPMSGWGLI